MTSIRFRVTQEMVDRFAALTGDRSSLHVNPAFARRSPFRRRVVHGMLPVMYLSRCVFPKGPAARLAELSAQFLEPAFPGDTLELSLSETGASTPEAGDAEEGRGYEYSIARVPSGELVTSGTLRMAPHTSGVSVASSESSEVNGASSIVPKALAERRAVFEDLSKGEEASFPVQITATHVSALREILSLGRDGKGEGEPSLALACTLLSAACSSTYVGMCMPGRFATFTELTSTWTGGMEGGTEATFAGQVRFLSPSTQTAVAQFAVETANGEAPIGQGRIKARVGDPPTVMPSMADVKKETDLGLRDRVVLVTGASRGIGETTAKLFGAHGARVIVNYYRGREDVRRVAREIVEAGGKALPVQADVSDPDAVQRLNAEAAREWGSIEILVNNAVGAYEARAFQDVQWSDVQRDLDVIVRGAFNCCQAVLPAMVERGFGRIVNLSTIAVENPPGDHAGYVVAKSALLGLTRSLAVEFAAHGICVNAVMPGVVETDLTSNMSKMARETIRQHIPMKRHASPLDVARAVVYLASDWSSYTTGQQIPVTGGQPPFH